LTSILVLEQWDRIYYIRAIIGAISGVILGSVLPYPSNNLIAGGLVFLIALIFFIISYIVAKKMMPKVKSDEKRKLVTNGIFPFIFLMFMFMIIVYTGLHGVR
jgi:protein-S-isoprenylcysteine O-methyltransferase Ste14